MEWLAVAQNSGQQQSKFLGGFLSFFFSLLRPYATHTQSALHLAALVEDLRLTPLIYVFTAIGTKEEKEPRTQHLVLFVFFFFKEIPP